jgi:hypothetical protein
MKTVRRGTKLHKQILENATGCTVYSEHNQYQGKKVDVGAAAMALHKFNFAKLVEQSDGRYVVHVHERCWFELEHGAAKPSTKKLQHVQDVTDPRGNVHSIMIYGKGDLRLGNMTFATMREVKAFITEQYPAEERRPAQKIRKSVNGKLHLSGGLSAANCSSGNRGMRLEGRVPATAAATFPRDSFCKKCFGSDPYGTVTRMVKAGYLE